MLPPLLTELRNEALQALVLPLVLAIIPQQVCSLTVAVYQSNTPRHLSSTRSSLGCMSSWRLKGSDDLKLTR